MGCGKNASEVVARRHFRPQSRLLCCPFPRGLFFYFSEQTFPPSAPPLSFGVVDAVIKGESASPLTTNNYPRLCSSTASMLSWGRSALKLFATWSKINSLQNLKRWIFISSRNGHYCASWSLRLNYQNQCHHSGRYFNDVIELMNLNSDCATL